MERHTAELVGMISLCVCVPDELSVFTPFGREESEGQNFISVSMGMNLFAF